MDFLQITITTTGNNPTTKKRENIMSNSKTGNSTIIASTHELEAPSRGLLDPAPANVSNIPSTVDGTGGKQPSGLKLLTTQMELLTQVKSLVNAANVLEGNTVLLVAKSSSGILHPLADEAVQSSFLNESCLNEIRGSILEALDSVIMQLSAQGLTFSEDAISILQTTEG